MIPSVFLNTGTASAPLALMLFLISTRISVPFIISCCVPSSVLLSFVYVVHIHFAQSLGTSMFFPVHTRVFVCCCRVLNFASELIFLYTKTLNHQQMHKEFCSSIVTHSYMFRPCWVIFRENFLLSLH
jgi:hypothetical protein